MQHLQPNTTLQGGKYRIERVLGQGGFGITYMGVQTSLERNVGIKEFFMKDFCSRDNTMMTTGSFKLVEQYRKKFIKEARNLARLSHPNIIGVIDIFEENDTVYYVMPYLTGGSLDDYVKKHGTLSETEAMRYVRQIASALKYMHEEQHICHYDVKPTNILLDNKGNAMLIDFGISKNYDASGHETTTTPIGMSEGYAPIEQYQQNVEEFSSVSDVYALGATLYFLLHGKRPVSAVHRASGTELMISEELSQEIKGIINASMKVSKRERAKNVDVFLKDASFSEQSTNFSVDSVVTDEETIIASEGNEEVPFEILLKRAEEGDAEAQNELGDCYYYGKKVEEDEEQAFIWYKKAAEQGHADAEYSLGWCYEYGEGVEKDEKKAFDCYVRSSGKGCVTAQFRIGSCYENGVGVSEDLKQAFCWYRKAAENGNADAQYSLGWCYEYGEGIAKNDQQAFKWYKKSAENGNREAQDILISHYNYGVGVWKKNDDDENDGNIDESFLENNGKSLKTEEKTPFEQSVPVKNDREGSSSKGCMTLVGICSIIMGYISMMVYLLAPLAYNSAYGLIPILVIVPVFSVIPLYSMSKLLEKKWNWKKWFGICISSMIMGFGVTYLFYKLIG